MSNIFKIQRNQTCVYWGTPVNDGFGKYTYAAPVELQCRWQDVNIMILDNAGIETRVNAVVYVAQDVDELGRMLLSTLADLTAAQKADPILAQSTVIKRVMKSPSISKPIRYVWSVYLGQDRY